MGGTFKQKDINDKYTHTYICSQAVFVLLLILEAVRPCLLAITLKPP